MGRVLTCVKQTSVSLWDELYGEDENDSMATAIESLKRLKHSLLMASMLGSCMTAKSSDGHIERIKNLKNCANKLTSEKISCILDILQHDISLVHSEVARHCQFCATEIEAKIYLSECKVRGAGIDGLLETSTLLLKDENVWRKKKRYLLKNSVLIKRETFIEEMVRLQRDEFQGWVKPGQEIFCKQIFPRQRNIKRREETPLFLERKRALTTPGPAYEGTTKKLKVMHATSKAKLERTNNDTRRLSVKNGLQSFWVGKDEPLSTEEDPEGVTEEDGTLAPSTDYPRVECPGNSPSVRTVICGNQSPNAIINEIRGCLLRNSKF